MHSTTASAPSSQTWPMKLLAPQSSGVHCTVVEQSNAHPQASAGPGSHTISAAWPLGQIIAIAGAAPHSLSSHDGETTTSSLHTNVCETIPT